MGAGSCDPGCAGSGRGQLCTGCAAGGKNSFTIRFKELKFETHLYQYHGIAHVWVRGQEHWRQLVYRLGIVKDKYQFLGEETCTREEKELLPLLEFAPFRSWISVPWDEGSVFSSPGRG